MPKYRKKSVAIEAIKWTGENLDKVQEFLSLGRTGFVGGNLAIITLEGIMIANEMDWIIKGVKGEYYLCKPDIFEKTYEPID